MEGFFKANLMFCKKAWDLTKSELMLLLRLASLMDFNNKILWDAFLRESVSRSFRSERNLQNILSRLIAKGFVRREGFYLIVNDLYLKKGRG